MEESPKNIQTINESNNINEEEISIKNEINDLNFFFNIKENENENDNNDYDEDNKEENFIFKSILDDLNNNIEINIKNYENKNSECQEILDILGGVSPFKPLIKPKKISMIGKVLIGIPDEEHNNSKENTTLNDNNNGKN